MEKLFVYDVETTGLDSKVNGIHQISGMIVIDGKTTDVFNVNVRPFDGCIYEESALKVSGVTEEQVKEKGLSERMVHAALLNSMCRFVNKFDKSDKFHLVGYNNASFDNQFLRALWLRNQDLYFGSWFWADTIDVMCLASNALRHVRGTMSNFKLSTVAEQFGIKVEGENLHDAKYDIELTYKIYQHLNK